METITFTTHKELLEAVRSGKIDGSKLFIQLDNDETYFRLDDGSEDGVRIIVQQANGYYDIEPLYELLFPDSKVEWV